MATLTISLNEGTLSGILSSAVANGLTLDEQIQQILSKALKEPPRKKPMTIEAALKLAMDRTAQKGRGDQFLLPDLFSEHVWRDEVPAHNAFGRWYRKAVEEAKIAIHIGKTSDNKAIYQRC